MSKMSKNYKNLKMRKYKYRMWCKETAQPIRDESYPHPPPKPISDTYLRTYLLTYLLTNSMLQSPSCEANRFSAS